MSSFNLEEKLIAQKEQFGEGQTLTSNIFQFPVNFLLKNHEVRLNQASISVVEAESTIVVSNEVNKKGLTCNLCSLVFQNHAEQATHFKSDFHCHNLKRKSQNEPPVSEEVFQNMHVALKEENKEESDAEDDSSTDSSSSSDDEDEVDYNRYEYQDEFGKITKLFHPSYGPMFNFQITDNQPWQFLVSLASFPNNSPFQTREWNIPSEKLGPEKPLSIWNHLYQNISNLQQNPTIAIFMLRSGKFAGGIFQHHNLSTIKSFELPSNPKNPSLIVHKVLRRYTVRAKAGGGQASYDNKQSKAKSMGAQLRRYGEKALQEDIENLLEQWKDYVSKCSLILIASTKRMRFKLFKKDEDDHDHHEITQQKVANTDSYLFSKNDTRITFVPFMVDKPTLETLFEIRNKSLQVIFHQQLENILVTSIPSAMQKKTKKNKQQKKNGVKFAGEEEAEEAEAEAEAEGNKEKEVNDQEKPEAVKSVDPSVGKSSSSSSSTNSQLLSNPFTNDIFQILETAKEDSEAKENLKQYIENHFIEIRTPAAAAAAAATNTTTTNNHHNHHSDSDEDNDNDEDEEESNEKTQNQNYFANLSFISKDYQYTLLSIINTPQNMETLMTPLHLATSKSFPLTIEFLFFHQANPEILDIHGRTPYFLANHKNIRDLYRRLRYKLGNDTWQWMKTGIPNELTNDMIQQKKEKNKLKKKKKILKKKEMKIVNQEIMNNDEKMAKLLQEEEERNYALSLQQQEYHPVAAAAAVGGDRNGKNDDTNLLYFCDSCQKIIPPPSKRKKNENIFILDQHPQYSFCSLSCMNLKKRRLIADAAMTRFKSMTADKAK